MFNSSPALAACVNTTLVPFVAIKSVVSFNTEPLSVTINPDGVYARVNRLASTPVNVV